MRPQLSFESQFHVNTKDKNNLKRVDQSRRDFVILNLHFSSTIQARGHNKRKLRSVVHRSAHCNASRERVFQAPRQRRRKQL